MLSLDLTLPTPAENLALDETLLDRAESGDLSETLRFWEPREDFVVVGYANRVSTEVNIEFCAASQIPIFRRCTGGGTVLQTPGVLNYSLILRADSDSKCPAIHQANAYIMERNRHAVIEALRKTHELGENASNQAVRLPDVRMEGHTDLTLDAKKFSGNAQRRRRNYLLFHGSFLLHADLQKIQNTLRMPSKTPEYRAGRTHQDFLTNLPVSVTDLKTALSDTWQAIEVSRNPLLSSLPGTVLERYQSHNWNQKFP